MISNVQPVAARPSAAPTAAPAPAPAPTGDDTGFNVLMQYGASIGMLPGVDMIEWDSSHPKQVSVAVSSPQFAQLDGQVLRTRVDGARIGFRTGTRHGDVPGGDAPTWASDPANILRMAAVLPGVAHINIPPDRSNVELYVDSPDAIKALTPLVRKRIAGLPVVVEGDPYIPSGSAPAAPAGGRFVVDTPTRKVWVPNTVAHA